MRKDFVKIVCLFLGWKLLLFINLIIAINFVPLGNTDKYLGGGFINYSISPLLYAWANFDGEHYLSIAIFGYKGLEQAFFPIYPKLLGAIANQLHFDMTSTLFVTTFVGIVISNFFLLLSLIILWDLVRLDYSKKIAYLTIISLLVFPTSFYFGSLYNESLFLFLTVSSFYAARKGYWWAAGIFGGVASATRIFGILLLPALFLQIWNSKTNLKQFIWLMFIPVGLILYMFYLKITVNDPIAFFHLQALVGEQRSSGFILLPQTFFRYISMLTTVSFSNTIYQTLILEFVTGLIFLILPIYGFFKKMSLSYVFYALIGFLVASAQGSFSSVPRYVLVLFPSFIALAIFLNTLPRKIILIILMFLSVGLIIESALFFRGYWVA